MRMNTFMARAMMTKILMSIVATTILFQLALAVDHNVGRPGGGWDTSTDLESWAKATFTVGDNLVFTYGGSHDVLEVTKDNYDSCSTSSPISTNGPSPTTIALTDAGSRYFICGTAGHCSQGMKVEIKTVAAASGPPTTGNTPPSSGDSPAPPAAEEYPKPGSAATVKIMSVVSMVGFGFLMMI
uniref:Uclacyanin 1-like n=1 Tax=Tanacetum cinerariifolium TaxID=118510 RepID=A0A699K5M7_TANCI|nr:uclacyanin 1-like [Tanacetum cinerariifolium]